METFEGQLLFDKIEETINQLRPFLMEDGGNIELLRVENNVAKVKLIGACHDCNMSVMTLKGGIEAAVKKAVPQITSVEEVEV